MDANDADKDGNIPFSELDPAALPSSYGRTKVRRICSSTFGIVAATSGQRCSDSNQSFKPVKVLAPCRHVTSRTIPTRIKLVTIGS